ncbi:MAG TPA: aldehyde dehydrogenase family protein, partial [Burkholderiaceae bacterium]|nr:aldehyde dehydrogenase family protein [Burkholderiaceae bacterium]
MKLKDLGLLKNQLCIDGTWRDSTDGQRFEVTNPATNDVITQVPNANAKDVQAALEAANTAWATWRAVPAKAR